MLSTVGRKCLTCINGFQCVECCSCYAAGELPDIIPSNSCNIRGECCSTPSPTVSPTKNPTQRPTTAAPTTLQPTPNPTTMNPTAPTSNAPSSSSAPSAGPTCSVDAAFPEILAFAQTKSSSSSLSNPTSPQYKAVEWLAQERCDDDGTFYSWSEYELLQRYVLRVLYHSTGGENWSNSDSASWFDTSRVCRWGSGVLCNGNGQQVDRIDLREYGLRGNIPMELGHLTTLTYLNLSVNLLSGATPTQLGQLSLH